MIDPFGRTIRYLRLSVTDRCDLRCLYCMPERMQFLPRADLLTLEELERIALAFVARGVSRIRITGGEPLVRKGVMGLIARLGGAIGTTALAELTLTTNGSRLKRHARDLFAAGVRRINVSLDTLDAARFAHITRGGVLADTLDGIAAAHDAGLAVKINTVALAGLNEDELAPLLRYAHARGFDFTLIETMPMGEGAASHAAHHLPLTQARARLEQQFRLVPSPYRSGGPARYFEVAETGGRLGLITPLSHNFCESCNRLRLTCTGRLYPCLGHETGTDLRAALRGGGGDAALHAAIDAAVAAKPRRHDFTVGKAAVARAMAVTGG
jgi:cyclic pyranopterin phosphate synthase